MMMNNQLTTILITLLSSVIANELPIMKVGNNEVTSNTQFGQFGWGSPSFIVRRGDINQNNANINQNFKILNTPFINGGLGADTGSMNNAGGVLNGSGGGSLSRRQNLQTFEERGPRGEIFTETIEETHTGPTNTAFTHAEEEAIRIAEMESGTHLRHDTHDRLLIDDVADTNLSDVRLEETVLDHHRLPGRLGGDQFIVRDEPEIIGSLPHHHVIEESIVKLGPGGFEKIKVDEV